MSTKRPAGRSIDVIGADANNLKNVDVRFPLERISVVTGVSGSGKSSLLADTLGAEGSRRTRVFLGTSQRELERDDVRAFIGPLPPTVHVGQRGFRPSVRTTIGTATGLLTVLRRLFISASVPYSERAAANVPRPSAESYADWIATHYRGMARIWAAPIREKKTDGVAAIRRLAAHGVVRATIFSKTDPPSRRESGREVDTRAFKGLGPNVSRTIEALVGEVRVRRASQRERLRELLELAFRAGDGTVVVMLPSSTDPSIAGRFGPRLDSERHWVHPADPAVYAGPNSHLLSFNAPEHEESGACPACRGTGVGVQLRERVLVSNPDRSMREGAFAIWTEKNYKYVNVQHETIEGLRGLRGFSPDTPWKDLPKSARALVLDGSDEQLIFDVGPAGRRFGAGRGFPGFRHIILEKYAASTRAAALLAPYVESGPCEVCEGTRWSYQARALRVGGRGIAELLEMTFAEMKPFTAARGAFTRAVATKARPLVGVLHRHAHSIASVGLDYLTGDRGMLEVSEGESRRVRLAHVLDAGQRGLCLLLDEPARGLHEADLPRLTAALLRLRGSHTVILNEHREGLWDAADWFVEVGPGAGVSGGEITYAGPRRNRRRDDQPLRSPVAVDPNGPAITIRGASIHNVDGVDCEIPLGRLTTICGVSGSGKSSFVRGVLIPALVQSVAGDTPVRAYPQGKWRSVSVQGEISEVVALDQSMPPPNRRSLVATFTGVLDDIRKVFGNSPDAKQDGLSATDFGVNAGSGRCPSCLGIGEVEEDELWSLCPACGGSRYGRAALSVRLDGVNVQELLDLPVGALDGYTQTFRIPRRLVDSMCDLGLGYVALGRRIDTLSGGEIQRLRLATRLSAPSAASALFVLDEPAVGLHADDVRRVASALENALEGGRNTVLIVEHDLRLIRASDWVLEFGPGSGPQGGRIILSGSPAKLAKSGTPTGLALGGKPRAHKRSVRVLLPSKRATETPALERQARTVALVRALMTGDATDVPTAGRDGAEPVVVLSDRFWAGRDGWEVAGLDYELPRFLLDLHRPSGEDVFTRVMAAWATDRDSWLAIQPFLTEMQIWGAGVPASTISMVSSHVSSEGMHLVTTSGKRVSRISDVRRVRAAGDRFVPTNDSEVERLRVLRDAFAVGARYVELRDGSGHLLATASDRLIDLDAALIAPIAPQPPHFSRLDPRGRCVMCDGKRVITVISGALVIGNRDVTPDSEPFLTPEARAVMKGVLRNELKPFLRRLAAEGLWDNGTPFSHLGRARQDMILFGFWSRPGAGSFLKKSTSSPEIASSWLRWDGLYRHVLDQAPRSKDAAWVKQLNERAQELRCQRCAGSGFEPYASLLRVGTLSFSAWAALREPRQVLEEVRRLSPQTRRQRITWQRIYKCLTPLAKTEEQWKLAAVAEQTVKSFTTMEPVQSRESANGS